MIFFYDSIETPLHSTASPDALVSESKSFTSEVMLPESDQKQNTSTKQPEDILEQIPDHMLPCLPVMVQSQGIQEDSHDSALSKESLYQTDSVQPQSDASDTTQHLKHTLDTEGLQDQRPESMKFQKPISEGENLKSISNGKERRNDVKYEFKREDLVFHVRTYVLYVFMIVHMYLFLLY